MKERKSYLVKIGERWNPKFGRKTATIFLRHTPMVEGGYTLGVIKSAERHKITPTTAKERRNGWGKWYCEVC